ncbi:MAG: hypothetical protein ACRC75_02230, partial [Olsenella sp.]
MEKVFRGVLRHRKVVVAVFVVLTAICLACISHVKIDADMSDYLPPSAKSSQDLTAMKEVYGNDITNARIYVTGISQVDASSFVDELKGEDDVVSVTWLGDEVDLDEPLEVQDQDTIDEWYDGQGYLFEAVLSDTVDQTEVDHIRQMAEDLPNAGTVAMDGSAISN